MVLLQIKRAKSDHAAVAGFDKVKYQLHKYHAERYWGIFVAIMLVYLYFLGFPWMPPVAFSQALQHPENVHTIMVTAGCLRMEDTDKVLRLRDRSSGANEQ
jgi:hypothetical protein